MAVWSRGNDSLRYIRKSKQRNRTFFTTVSPHRAVLWVLVNAAEVRALESKPKQKHRKVHGLLQSKP
jgi:hypothetical protein